MIERIESDLKSAMLARDQSKASILRLLKDELQKEAKNKGQELSNEDSLTVLRREAKKRKEAIDLYEKGGAPDKAAVERAELEVIKSYLPAQMDQAELIKIIDEVIAERGKDQSQMGVIIGSVMAKAKGQADGAEVAQLVRERIST